MLDAPVETRPRVSIVGASSMCSARNPTLFNLLSLVLARCCSGATRAGVGSSERRAALLETARVANSDTVLAATSAVMLAAVVRDDARLLRCVGQPTRRAGVSVWSIALDVADAAVAAERLLDDEERERAARYARPALRRRYVVAHGALRVILGRRLRVAPEQLTFARLRGGKPVLLSAEGLQFSLTHSCDLAVVAVSDSGAVGVDVEQLRAVEVTSMGSVACSSRERELLAALPEADRASAFLRVWTAKEAYLKATGDGLARDPSRLDFAALLSTSSIDHALQRVETFTPSDGYVAALATVTGRSLSAVRDEAIRCIEPAHVATAAPGTCAGSGVP